MVWVWVLPWAFGGVSVGKPLWLSLVSAAVCNGEGEKKKAASFVECSYKGVLALC